MTDVIGVKLQRYLLNREHMLMAGTVSADTDRPIQRTADAVRALAFLRTRVT